MKRYLFYAILSIYISSVYSQQSSIIQINPSKIEDWRELKESIKNDYDPEENQNDILLIKPKNLTIEQRIKLLDKLGQKNEANALRNKKKKQDIINRINEESKQYDAKHDEVNSTTTVNNYLPQSSVDLFPSNETVTQQDKPLSETGKTSSPNNKKTVTQQDEPLSETGKTSSPNNKKTVTQQDEPLSETGKTSSPNNKKTVIQQDEPLSGNKEIKNNSSEPLFKRQSVIPTE